jgi:predicted nucleic acid-binding protein
MAQTTDLPAYVVDASVAAKWYLQDEHDTAAADGLLADFREGRIHLLAPEHIRYEVASAIRNALRANRLTLVQARTAIAECLGWQIPTVGTDDLILAALDQAVHFGCSLYDGLYLALAESADCPLVYADHRLRNALGNRFPRAIWLADYVPAPAP